MAAEVGTARDLPRRSIASRKRFEEPCVGGYGPTSIVSMGWGAAAWWQLGYYISKYDVDGTDADISPANHTASRICALGRLEVILESIPPWFPPGATPYCIYRDNPSVNDNIHTVRPSGPTPTTPCPTRLHLSTAIRRWGLGPLCVPRPPETLTKTVLVHIKPIHVFPQCGSAHL